MAKSRIPMGMGDAHVNHAVKNLEPLDGAGYEKCLFAVFGFNGREVHKSRVKAAVGKKRLDFLYDFFVAVLVNAGLHLAGKAVAVNLKQLGHVGVF